MAVDKADDLLKGAIAGTEREIFDDANKAAEPEPEGDKSLEEMGNDLEGRDSPDGTDEGDEDDAGDVGTDGKTPPVVKDPGETKPPVKAGDKEEPETRKRVPVGELIEERKGRQAAQAERDQAIRERDAGRNEFAALNAKLDGALARLDAMQPKPKGADAEDQIPDIFADPDAFLARRDAAMEQRFTSRLVEGSMAAAASQHGDKFEAAYKAITALNPRDPTDRATVQQIWNAPNPGAALMSWYGRNETLRRVGTDPDKYITEEIEKRFSDPAFLGKAIERARSLANGQDGGKPNTTVRAPLRSLNSAAGGGNANLENDPSRYDNSEGSVFDHATR